MPGVDAFLLCAMETRSQVMDLSQNGASITQMIAKIIDVLTSIAKVDGLEYMEATETITRARDISGFLDRIGDRYCEQMLRNHGHG